MARTEHSYAAGTFPGAAARRGDDNGSRRDEQVARAIGWFSIGLGLTEIVAHRRLSEWMGLEDRPRLVRMMGVREIVAGLGILTQDRPVGWMWARVAGDAIDLAGLGAAMAAPGARRDRVALATALVAGVTLADIWCSRELSYGAGVEDAERSADGTVHVRKSITIDRAPQDLYRFWRNFENLPQIMKHLDSVQVIDSRRSHWVAKGPLHARVEWDAEITDDRPNERIAWRSTGRAWLEHCGAVEFRRNPHGEGTIVEVTLSYKVPGGRPTRTLARLLGSAPEQRVKEDLRPFKQLMETGEISTTRGQPTGRRGHQKPPEDFRPRWMPPDGEEGR